MAGATIENIDIRIEQIEGLNERLNVILGEYALLTTVTTTIIEVEGGLAAHFEPSLINYKAGADEGSIIPINIFLGASPVSPLKRIVVFFVNTIDNEIQFVANESENPTEPALNAGQIFISSATLDETGAVVFDLKSALDVLKDDINEEANSRKNNDNKILLQIQQDKANFIRTLSIYFPDIDIPCTYSLKNSIQITEIVKGNAINQVSYSTDNSLTWTVLSTFPLAIDFATIKEVKFRVDSFNSPRTEGCLAISYKNI